VISLDHDARNDCDLVVLKGRLVAAVCASVADELVAIFDEGCGVLCLEMSGVEHIDSKGLSTLVSVMKRVHNDEGVFNLMNISDEVLTLLELTGLYEVFDIRGDDSSGHQRVA